MIHLVRKKIIHPLQKFMHDSRAIGITLLGCTLVSLILANIGLWKDAYRNFWSAHFTDTLLTHTGFEIFPNAPILFINDGLMALFFFLAGMEIKRELMIGELASIKRSILPVGGAIGGMLVPALLFTLINQGSPYQQGWAIPTATDIAFTLGLASLLGKRVPIGLKIFITALAIIDDLGAILIIAFFYGGQLHILYIFSCFAIIACIWALNRNKIKFGLLHWLLGTLLWYCMYRSGIHATVAGVIFAFMVPAHMLSRLELAFHKPVYFIIIPVFALANTAILLPANSFSTLNNSLNWGIMAGLCLGKPMGIFAVCYFLVKAKIANLPAGVTWYKMAGAGLLCGIGFTMSIFISALAFTNPAHQDIAKISVLIASAIAILAGYGWFMFEKNNSKLHKT